jgi:hypothetical protein
LRHVWELQVACGSGLQTLNLGFEEEEDGWDLIKETQVAPGLRLGLKFGPRA